MSNTLDQNFWNTKWETQETGWDIGKPSTPISDYFGQIENKNLKILIPGCGNAHEAQLLLEMGFQDITLLDIAPKAVEIISEKFQNATEIKIFCEDFFEHHGQYDLIVEQTFFCALDPKLRTKYIEKMTQLLAENGKLIGVLFNTDFGNPFPPFGGNIDEYKILFEEYFILNTLQTCRNSILPRKDNEVFINFTKKNKI